MKIAFLGIGNMGAAMARNLVKGSHEVRAWNRTQARVKEVPGAIAAATPADAARGADLAFTMLADDAAVEAVVFGNDGILNALPKGAIHVSASTISVDLSRRMQKAHEGRGQQYVSAPVFGRPAAADAGQLFVVAAGADDAVKKCEPLFATFGQKTFVMGNDPVSANVVKLAGNFLIATIIESLGEAVALTRKYDVEPQAFIDFLTSSLFAAPIFKIYGGLVASQQFEPAGFKLRLGLKDIRLALAAGEAAQVPLPIADLMRANAVRAVNNGMGDLDWSALSKIAAENAGLK
ncbi:MAG TPA: NAD(P)-dependent oxidoreductase [Terriglobales bacterium]|nr:NAD(P)-dependent oxidoreductase [Terriglobales bacterium]